MAGAEREFMGKMDMLPPRDEDHTYPQTDSMRDFWRTTSDRDSQLQEMRESGRGGQTNEEMHHLQEHSLRPYSFIAELAETDSVTMEAPRSGLTSSHNVYYNDCQPYTLDTTTTSSNASQALMSSNVYTNFFNTSCIRENMKQASALQTFMTTENDGGRYPLPPVAVPISNEFSGVCSESMPSESVNRDMESLQRELAYKCPRSSQLLMDITNTAEATVREHGSGSGSALSSDEDDAPDQDPVSEQDLDLRAAIIDHPYYPEMVLAHVRIFKIGAPRGLRNKLDDVTKKFQRFQEGSTLRIGDDPALDFFMRSYVDLLSKFGEDLEEPFNKFMQFKDSTTKALEDICGHYIETGPDEEDNYGFDIGPIDGAQDSDDLEMLGDESLMYPVDIDESIIVDPTASDEELRKTLMRKYGRHIGGLKAEFNRVRKKGKLPANARTILKDWFNRHSYWPYPSEVEKQYLQRLCNLNLKQINNWFINERKRHWSCEGKCMHPNTKFYNNSNGQGKGHVE